MANRARTFWASEPEHGPGGIYRVVVARLAATPGAGGQRDTYSATLFKKADSGEQAVEIEFWKNTAPPHDADKLAFRERARRAARPPGEQAAGT